MIDDENSCYILAFLEGPFGEMTQVSARMRPSEAAMTIASLLPEGKPPKPKGMVYLKSMEIVLLRKDLP